jgi:hypothetical protein
MMLDTRIILAGLWAAVMLTYLWGDVLSVLSGDATPGKLAGTEATEGMWFSIAILMMTPVFMLVLTLTLKYSAARWVNIIAAALWILFNLVGLKGYTLKEKVLLIISIGFNGLMIWYAWNWTA